MRRLAHRALRAEGRQSRRRDRRRALPQRHRPLVGVRLRLVVADGASETLLSGPWAAVLARSYAQRAQRGRRRAAGVAELGVVALGTLATSLPAPATRDWPTSPVVRGARLGGWRVCGAVGLTLSDGEAGGDWSALALGDSCLFQVRSDRTVIAFPVVRAADFGVRPFLIGSRDTAAGSVLDAFRGAAGRWRPGDRFYLMTDALAQWWLAECEAGRAPWRPLDRLCSPGRRHAFPKWIATRRRRHDIKNDDVTLLRVACGRSHDALAATDRLSGSDSRTLALLRGPAVAPGHAAARRARPAAAGNRRFRQRLPDRQRRSALRCALLQPAGAGCRTALPRHRRAPARRQPAGHGPVRVPDAGHPGARRVVPGTQDGVARRRPAAPLSRAPPRSAVGHPAARAPVRAPVCRPGAQRHRPWRPSAWQHPGRRRPAAPDRL